MAAIDLEVEDMVPRLHRIFKKHWQEQEKRIISVLTPWMKNIEKQEEQLKELQQIQSQVSPQNLGYKQENAKKFCLEKQELKTHHDSLKPSNHMTQNQSISTLNPILFNHSTKANTSNPNVPPIIGIEPKPTLTMKPTLPPIATFAPNHPETDKTSNTHSNPYLYTPKTPQIRTQLTLNTLKPQPNATLHTQDPLNSSNQTFASKKNTSKPMRCPAHRTSINPYTYHDKPDMTILIHLLNSHTTINSTTKQPTAESNIHLELPTIIRGRKKKRKKKRKDEDGGQYEQQIITTLIRFSALRSQCQEKMEQVEAKGITDCSSLILHLCISSNTFQGFRVFHYGECFRASIAYIAQVVPLRFDLANKMLPLMVVSKAKKEHIVQIVLDPVTVIVHGEPNKPAIITYSDMALNHVSCFQGVFCCPEAASLLLHNFCIYHISPPGHELGAAAMSRDEPSASVDDLADQIIEILNHFRLGAVMCLGMTTGAYIISLFALKYRDRVLGLILKSPLCQAPSWSEWLYNKWISNLLYHYGMCNMVKECLLRWYFSKEVWGHAEVLESDIVKACRRVLNDMIAFTSTRMPQIVVSNTQKWQPLGMDKPRIKNIGGSKREITSPKGGPGTNNAVKQLDQNGLLGNWEFLVEVLMLSLLHNPNLVNLIGYCADGDQRLLAYEFMPLESLEDHLHDLLPNKEWLDSNIRMKITTGAAKGLEYLHNKAKHSQLLYTCSSVLGFSIIVTTIHECSTTVVYLGSFNRIEEQAFEGPFGFEKGAHAVYPLVDCNDCGQRMNHGIGEVGSMAYHRDNSPYAGINPTFHDSQLEKNHDPRTDLTFELPAIYTEKKFEPLAILDRKIIKRRDKDDMLVLTSWKEHSSADATWEFYHNMRRRFPNHSLWTRNFDGEGNEVGEMQGCGTGRKPKLGENTNEK